MSNFDVVIIGSGPGGYVTAIRAAQLGLKTAIIERENLGGVCLNWGCIPTKALLKSSEVYVHMKHAKDYGVIADKFSFDLNAIVQRSRNVSKQLSGGVAMLLKKNKVEVFMGSGSLLGGGKVEITAEDGKKSTIDGKHIIIATGSRARVIPNFEPDGKFVWTYREALDPKEMPKKLLVMGSGAIGIEFANFYHNLGAEVTIVELMDRIIPVEDEEISIMARKAFEKKGIKILTSTKVMGIKKNKDDVSITLEDNKGVKSEIIVDKVISAVGIVANIENIGIEKTKIKTENGRIVVDEFLRTAEPNVYAIGDVVQGPWLAHKASHEGIICVEKIAGKNPHPIDRTKIPGCTYSQPQVASVGLTERKARELGIELKIGRFPFIGNGKAIALGEPDGLIKTIFNAKTGELLGAHMIGYEVTEMIQGYVIAMGLETTEEELMHTIFAHPTLSEMMHESVLQAYGKAIHI
jgi:dihydrolipoamide dehydrogenase